MVRVASSNTPAIWWHSSAVKRVINFSSGPAMLPEPVLQQVAEEMLNWQGSGMSVMEISHRSKEFEAILHKAVEDIRALANIPSNYKVLMLQGGASLQFSMVPMNLLTPGATADYIDSGSWADKAIKEAKKVGTVNVAATTKGENYSRLPEASELKLTPGAAYVHMTSNNTIEGTEYKALPEVGDVPLVSDTSSMALPLVASYARSTSVNSTSRCTATISRCAGRGRLFNRHRSPATSPTHGWS